MRTAFLVILVAAACNGSDGMPLPDGGGGGNGGGSGGGSTSPSAPKILTLATNLRTLHETEMLTVSAVVTDPDGIGDVIGGQLMSVDGNAAYGAFATDAGEGAYSLTLSWATINSTESIDTGVGMPASRTFRATFFDAEGNSSYREVTVALQCRDTQKAACGGTCQTSMADYTMEQCGACGHSCSAIGAEECRARTSDNVGVCFVWVETTQRVSCATQCTGTFHVCYGGAAVYAGVGVNSPCNSVPPATNSDGAAFEGLGCYCGDL